MERQVKVHIGKHYAPTWYERRGNNGEYSALRPPISVHEERLQRALLPGLTTHSSVLTRTLYIIALVSALVMVGGSV